MFATDLIGNVSSKEALVTVVDKILPVVKTKNINLWLNANGVAKLSPDMIDNGSSDNCSIKSKVIDKTDFTCANFGANTVKLSVYDPSGNTVSATSVVTVIDTVKPKSIAKDITLTLSTTSLIITASQINNGSTDNCGIKTLSVSPSTFNCSHVGKQIVTLTVTDNSGNISSAIATLTIVKNPPVVKTKNITVFLNSASTVSILPSDVNNATTDFCGALTFTLDKSSFNCSNTGANTVILKATDIFGISSTATAIVTVQEKIAPIVKLKNISLPLNQSGTALISFENIDNGTSDNCGIKTCVLDKTQFYCSNIGANTVKVTVTDGSGNVATATCIVTIVDNIAPLAQAKDITASLINGSYTLLAATINNASSDNCGIKTMTVSPSTFNCSQIGVHTITLTVTDNSGNVSSTLAKLTLLGSIPSCNIKLSADTPPLNNDFNTVYLGFGNQTINLTCNALNGSNFTYAWTGPNLSSLVAQKVTFKPTASGKYIITCTSKNQFGCETKCNVEICVIDVRSTDISGMVFICHTSSDGLKRTLSVSPTNAAKMLVQYPNDRIGVCNIDCNSAPITRKIVNISNAKSLFSVPGYVVAQNPFTNGTGWSAAIYTPSEMTNKGTIKGVNVLSSLRWRVDRDMNYGSQHRIYKGVNIYIYHAGTALSFPNTNKPTLPAGAVKVFSGNLDFVLPDLAWCFMDVPFNLNNFYYNGVSSVVVYIEKTASIVGSSVSDPWVSYNEDSDAKKIRFVGNWSGLSFTTSNYNSVLKPNRYPQVIFNETKTLELCDKSIFAVNNTVIVTKSLQQVIPVEGTSNEIVVYPNPSQNEFNLRFDSPSDAPVEIRVYDLSGSLLLHKTGLTPNEIISFGLELTTGMFIAEIQQAGFRKSIKIYKTN